MPNYCFRTTFIATLLFDSILVHSQLLCSIEKAVWKLAQSGPSTEANMYHYRFVYTSTFSLNGRISETKRDILDPLAPKWPQRIGLRFTLSWKWPHPIFTPFFGVFLERNPFFGVFQVGQIGPLRSKTCPWDPFPTCKKETIPGSPIDRFPECFVTSFGAKISLFGRYLWNGASTSKIEESVLQFFWDFGPGEVPPDIKMSFLGHFWAILSHFWSFLGHLGPYRVILGHFFPISDHFWSQVGPPDIKMSFLGHFGSFLAHIRSFGAI